MATQRYESNLLKIRTRQERAFFKNYLQPFNINLVHQMDTSVSLLSGGEQQALALALSVLPRPQVLLLDEHTSALDPQSAINLMQITEQVVREYRITCILSTHDLEIATQYGNKILALHQGQVLKCFDEKEKRHLTKQALINTCY